MQGVGGSGGIAAVRPLPPLQTAAHNGTYVRCDILPVMQTGGFDLLS